jgi:hypothetical protein
MFPVPRYAETIDDAVISLEPTRSPLRRGAYWLLTSAILLSDGSYVGGDPPVDLVVRDPQTGRVLHRNGPLHGADAVARAQEAARVIRVLGVAAYIERESG